MNSNQRKPFTFCITHLLAAAVMCMTFLCSQTIWTEHIIDAYAYA